MPTFSADGSEVSANKRNREMENSQFPLFQLDSDVDMQRESSLSNAGDMKF